MKYFFFDIDGTLKPYGKEIPLSTKKALNELKNRGHKIFLATGRRRNEILDFMDDLNIDSAVCAGGACVVIDGKVEKETYFEEQELRKIIDECRKNKVLFAAVREGSCAACYGGWRLKPYTYAMRIYAKFKKIKIGSVEVKSVNNFADIKMISEEEMLKTKTQKILFFRTKNIDKVDVLKKYRIYNERIWKTIEFDFKEKGIEFIKEKCKINMEDIVVFGDGHNDLSMFKKYPVNSVAMGNSCSELKETASFITKNSDDDGIYYACKKFGWI